MAINIGVAIVKKKECTSEMNDINMPGRLEKTAKVYDGRIISSMETTKQNKKQQQKRLSQHEDKSRILGGGQSIIVNV